MTHKQPLLSPVTQILLFVVLFNLAWHISALFEVAPNVSGFYIPPAMSMALAALIGFRAIPIVMLAAWFSVFPLEDFWVWTLDDVAMTLRQGIVYGIAGAFCRFPDNALNNDRLLNGVSRFLVAALAGSLVSAIWAAGVFHYWSFVPPHVIPDVFLSFWAGDAAGIIMFTPLLFVVFSKVQSEAVPHLWRHQTVDFWVRSIAVPCGLSLAGFAVLQLNEVPGNFGYLLVLVVAWVATRHGVVGGALAALSTNLAAIVAFDWVGKQIYPTLEVQVLFAAMAVTGLLIGAAFDEREELARERAEKDRAMARIARTRAVGEIGATIGHELNSALQTTSIHLGMARSRIDPEKMPEQADLLDALNQAQDTIDRAADFQDRIRHFLRGKSGEEQSLDVVQVIETALSIFSPVAERSRINLRFDPPGHTCTIQGNDVELQHALINLLDNARASIVHSRQDDNSPKGWIALSLRQGTKGTYELVVEDSGPGFSDAALEKGFTSFFTTRDEGMGMGLAITKSIIESHDGTIHLANGAHGARIALELPTREDVTPSERGSA